MADMQQCPICGSEFPKNPRKIYCSDKCRDTAAKRRKTIKRKEAGLCPQCGKPFRKTKGTYKESLSYCGLCKQYFHANYSRKRKILREIEKLKKGLKIRRKCQNCGKLLPSRSQQKFCRDCLIDRRRESMRNYHTRVYQRKQERRKIGNEYLCERCGTKYVLMSSKQIHCPKCFNEKSQRKKEYYQRKRQLEGKIIIKRPSDIEMTMEKKDYTKIKKYLQSFAAKRINKN